MRDFFLNDEDRAFRSEVREFLNRELAPRIQDIEDNENWDTVKHVVHALGESGYMKPMFADLYQGPLSKPGLTHATILSEEAAYLNYGFETTIATALSCAYPLHRFATNRIREQYLTPILEGKAVGSVCMTEPNVGSDSAGMQTSITFDEKKKRVGYQRL